MTTQTGVSFKKMTWREALQKYLRGGEVEAKRFRQFFVALASMGKFLRYTTWGATLFSFIDQLAMFVPPLGFNPAVELVIQGDNILWIYFGWVLVRCGIIRHQENKRRREAAEKKAAEKRRLRAAVLQYAAAHG